MMLQNGVIFGGSCDATKIGVSGVNYNILLLMCWCIHGVALSYAFFW